MRTFNLFFIAVFFVPFWLFSQSEQLIPRQELFKNPTERNFWPSYSGNYAFWTDRGNNTIQWVHTKSKERGQKEIKGRIFQAGPYKGDDVVVIKQNNEKRADEMMLYNLKTGQSQSLLTAPRLSINHWTKNGMVYSERNPETRENSYFHLSFDGELKSLGSFQGLQSVFFDNSLKPATAKRQYPDGSFELLYWKNGDWQILQKLPWSEGNFIGGLQGIISGTPDGKFIYYVSNHESDKNVLYEFNTETKASKILASSKNADILPQAALLDKDFKPIYVVSLFGESQKHFVQDWFKEHYEIIDAGIEGEISVVDPMWDAGKIMFREFTGGPNKYYMYDVNQKELTFLYEEYSWLNKYDFADRKAFSYTTSDGLELPIHVYLPNGTDSDKNGIPNEPLPTIVYVHGGPWVGLIHFNSWMHTRNFQLLANRGYAVVVAEFRGTTGLGKEVIQKSYKKWGTDMTRDKKELSEWLVKNKIAPRDKIGIWGWSYGGYAAMAGLAFYPDTYACGISMYGPPSIVPEEGTAGYGDLYWAKQVGDPNIPEDLKMLAEQSPINYVENIKKPLLLTTGSQDNRISKPKNDLMAKKMKEAGKDITYFFYPEEGHDYRNPESWISFWAYAEEFLAKHLGGEVEPNEADKKVGNYEMVYLSDTFQNKITGQWKGPGDVVFDVKENGGSYIAKVVDPGKMTILKKNDFLFDVKYKDGKYKGDYRRFFEENAYNDEPCSLEVKDDKMVASYGVTYQRITQ